MVGELVGAYLATQCVALASNDIGLRTGAPVVHQPRVAARRLRSTLRTFDDAFDPAPAEELNNELAWYADLLGQVRDREVLNARLITLIAELPPEHVRGSVADDITKTLATERDDATQRLNAAMRTRRYQHLVQLLRAWKAAPPFTDAAAGKEKTAVKYVEAAKHGRTNGYARQMTTSREVAPGAQGGEAVALRRRARRAGRWPDEPHCP
jgi:CHAD domain-containing protein